MQPSSAKKEIQMAQTDTNFRLMADTIPNLCWMADADGVIYWYNQRWYDYTGTTPKEMQKRGWQSMHDPKELPHILSKWKDAITTKEPFVMVVSLMGADGMYRPFLSHIVPSKDKNGKVTGWLGIKNDITELRAADEALRASEEKFKTFAEAMPQIVFLADKKGDITFFNQRWYDYIGEAEGTEGWGWKDRAVHHPDDLAKTIKRWNDSLKTGKDYEIEYRLLRHDGEYRWHLGRAVAVRDQAGNISYWIGTNTDIHEQRRRAQSQAFLSKATKELSSSLEYKKTLASVTKLCVPEVADWCSVDLLNAEGTIEQVAVAHVDPNKVQMAKKFRARNPVQSTDPGGVAKVIRTGKVEFYPEINNQMLEASIKDKITLKLLKSLQLKSIIIAPIIVKGKPAGALTFITSESGSSYDENDCRTAEELSDRVSLAVSNSMLYTEAQDELKRRTLLEKELIRERNSLEERVARRTEQLNELNVSLERSNQELQDFAYVASHDLQEPLRKIQAFGDILQSEFGETLGDGSEYLKRMNAAATRMSRLIEDLLVFSRVTTRPPMPRQVDLNAVSEDVISDLENRITKTGGTVTIERLPVVLADPTHMHQLLQNLIGNGLKFHRENVAPVVTVRSRSLPDLPGIAEITVEDNGIGFDKKYADRIFGVFQRLHGRGTYEGTGIGLAVCRKIVERYDGTITAEGKPGKGSKFIVRLRVVTKETADDN